VYRDLFGYVAWLGGKHQPVDQRPGKHVGERLDISFSRTASATPYR
jgi:hypothetical protein